MHIHRQTILAFLFIFISSSFGADTKHTPLRVAILASGSGSNAEAIWNYFEQEGKKGTIKPTVLICNRKSARVFERAKNHTIPAVWLPSGIRKDMTPEEKEVRRKAYAQEMITTLEAHGVTPENGLVCGAGFMVMIHKNFLDHFKNQVISIHPTLLPSFAGDSGIDDAFKYGVKVSGPTVHIVDEGMDTGPIIAQNPFIVAPNETRESFEEKTHQAEWSLYPWVIEQIALGKMHIQYRNNQPYVTMPELPFSAIS